MALRIAINGFGRIGRAAFRVMQSSRRLELVAINDLTSTETLAHLLKYDTAYGQFNGRVDFDKQHLVVNGKKYKILSNKNPAKLPWRKLKVDVVLECTGFFTKNDAADAHLKAGAKRVVVSAPTKGGTANTYLLGVNAKEYKKDKLVSNASCTTNCAGPVTSVIERAFGVQKASLTTIHSYTAGQNLVDGPPRRGGKDLRRARAAAENIVPTTTGAAIATTKTIPELEGLFDGIAIRVPILVGSLSDFTFLLKKEATVEAVNRAFRRAAGSKGFKGILAITEEPIVSSDIVGNSHSAIVDLSFTKVIDGNLLKVLAWYDNEWGYANRLVELAELVGRTIK